MSLRPADWPEVVEFLERAPRGEASPAWFHDQLKAGTMELLAVELDGKLIGAIIIWVDAMEWGRELVLASAAVETPDHNGMVATLPVVENLARDRDCTSLRFFTSRSGVERIADRLGYERVETVMRKVL